MTMQIEIPYTDDALRLTVREAEPADGNALLNLLAELQMETDNLLIEEEVSRSDQQALLQTYQQAPDSIYLVVEVDGQLVGLANIAAEPHSRLAHRGEIGVALMRDYWGLGLGSLLLDELIHFAQSTPLEMLSLSVLADNAAAIHLYEQKGFVAVGRWTNYVKRADDEEVDAILMECRLDKGDAHDL